MPKEIFGDDFVFYLKKSYILTFEEMTRISRIYAELGVKRLELLEANLWRRNLYQLIEQLNEIEGIEDIGLTTNGLLLKKHGHSIMQDSVALM